ncbi:hypothetical protein NKH52_35060, partial [Mesorhizobium sp. M1066]|uniref:hypothetical protein n=1 Tax=Mesorhizobium TaxID=68287 RepID=UPI0033358106
PREEPGAGNPPARICEGESRMAELLDHDLYVQRTALNATAGILPWLELDLVDRIERPRVLKTDQRSTNSCQAYLL